MANNQPIFLVIGPPAVGKSTTCRAIATQFPRSLHIPVDDLRNMVVSGLELPGAEWNASLAQQITLARTAVVDMAQRYQSAGFTVVIDDFWDPGHLADYQGFLGQSNVHQIILFPDQDEAHLRNLKRSGDSPARAYIDEGIRNVYQQLAPSLPRLVEEGWIIIDTTKLSVESTVKMIFHQTATKI